MKKILMFILILCLVLGAVMVSYSATSLRTIKSVRITVNTSGLRVDKSISSDAQTYIKEPSSRYYSLKDAKWVDDISDLEVGDTPRIRVWLESEDITQYIFRGGYSSSNVSITNGTFVSAQRQDSGHTLMVTLRVNAVRGTYSSPISVGWRSSLGTAVWTADDNDSGYYNVFLYRGSTVIKSLYQYKGRSYNFYPYMTREGEYFYRVRTVPGPDDSAGSSSGWTDSSDLYIDEDQVSDGSGQTDADTHGGSAAGVPTTGAVTNIDGVELGENYGWINVSDSWYFRYPDKTLATGWIRLNDVYYRLDDDGRMHTGWYLNPYGQWYYLDPGSGAMLMGWINLDGNYYYLDPRDYESQGMMLTGLQNIGGRIYYFSESGAMLTGWQKIGDGFYYFYPAGSTDGEYGYLATNTYIGYFYVGADGAWRAG